MKLLNNKEVGKRLETERLKTNLTKRKYALGAKVDPSQYRKIEAGELPMTEAILKKLIMKYNLDKEHILYGDKYGTNVPRGIEQQPALHTKSEEKEPKGSTDASDLIRAVLTLTEANKTLVDSNAKLVNMITSNSGGTGLAS